MIIVLVVMLSTGFALSGLLLNQNRKTSELSIQNSLAIIREELSLSLEKISDDVRTTSIWPRMGNNVTSINNYKNYSSNPLLIDAYRQVAKVLYQVCKKALFTSFEDNN